jgi:hypothetical protein
MHKNYQNIQYRNRRIMEEMAERPIRPEVAIPLYSVIQKIPNKNGQPRTKKIEGQGTMLKYHNLKLNLIYK